MAIILVLLGGVLGFASAIASLIVLDAGLLFALAIWAGTGIVFALAGVALAMLPRPHYPANLLADPSAHKA